MGHEYFAEISEDFIEDDFNLTGLQSQVPMYKDALEMILDVEPSETGSSALSEEEEEEDDDDGILGDDSKPLYDRDSRRHGRLSSDTAVIESSAELLYGLIHARYITSRPGIQQMLEKYEHAHFGYCPRVHCNGCKVLPVGRTDTPGQETVKLFCPSCLDIYTPPNSRFQSVDGAFFGTTFPSLFFMTFPELEFSTVQPTPATSRSQLPPISAADNTMSPSMTSSTLDSYKSGSTAQANGTVLGGQSELIAHPTIPPQPTNMNGFLVQNFSPGLGNGHIYEARIYGFRVSERAKSGPRMRWLRMKPDDIYELDETTRWHERYGGDPDGDPDPVDEEDGDISEDEDAEETYDQEVGEIATGVDVEMAGAASQTGQQRKKGRRKDNGGLGEVG
ncbi:putative casein kinase ii subunit beta-1 [Phaeomoniella chlamydospora]|uniref:Casein kinase II subunit beta n=1 Tax=Phaeomoniella chlamydospora TaxID=158046 RepID=A0A0G2ECU2_PHACM|nr:putative casein kinase ii subunit beta-1 [Phaeomoniella chlamydospora]